MKLLALDLSSNIGFALFAPGGPPRFGTLALEGQGKAAICGKFGDWLEDFYSVDRFAACAWEAPFLKPGDKVDKIKILVGLVGVAFAFVGSARHPMPHAEIGPKEVKRRMTGRQDAEKADVIAACWSIGWKVRNDHEADACGVGLCAYEQIFPRRAAA